MNFLLSIFPSQPDIFFNKIIRFRPYSFQQHMYFLTHEEKKLTFSSYYVCALRHRGEGLRALAYMSAKNVIFFWTAHLRVLLIPKDVFTVHHELLATYSMYNKTSYWLHNRLLAI